MYTCCVKRFNGHYDTMGYICIGLHVCAHSVIHSPPNTASNVSWLQQIQNILKRSNKIAPSIPGNFLQRYGDAPKLHHNGEIELSNKNSDVAVAASRLHVNTLEVPH